MPPTPIVNPPYAGDVLTMTNSAHVQFSVATTPVSLADARYNLISLTVSYDGKELNFTEIPTPNVSNPAFALDAAVELKMNLGDGIKTYFTGKIRRRSHQGRNREPLIEYVAVGTQQLSNDIALIGVDRTPLYQKFNGSAVMTASATKTTYGGDLFTAITHVFTLNRTNLSTIGVTSDVGSPGLDSFPGGIGLPRDLSIQNQPFGAGLRQICDYYPQVKPFFDDTQQAWTFPNLLTAPEAIIDISSVNMPELVYEMSLEGRYTAMRLVAPYDGRLPIPFKGTATCQPDWDPALQDSWCMQAVAQEDPADNASGYQWVYRKWTIPVDQAEINPHAPVRAFAQFNYNGQVVYQAVQAQIDLQDGVIYTASPVVIRGNAWAPGSAVGPDALVFTWYKIDSITVGQLAEVRVPASGWEGTAADLFGVNRTKFELVDLTEISAETAQAKLNLVKDVLVSGDVVLEGDPIKEVINLNRRVYIRSSVQTTGIESLACLLMGYTYEFGRRGKNTLSFTTDVSGLIRVN